ncbi:MAG: 4Fe-4S dicluster domain-containing protein, partial [Polyangiaceae bacterium]
PAYASPADLDLATKIRRAKRSVYLGAHENETAAACTFFVPQAPALATWGDARAFDGTQSVVQPLTAATDDAKTTDEILASFLDDFHSEPSAHDLVRAWWRSLHANDFDASWREALRKGVVANSAFSTKATRVDWSTLTKALSAEPLPSSPAGNVEIALREDARVRDGASTNNPWLLELPDPVTKLTWENAALISKTTAAKLSVTNGDVVSLKVGGFAVDAPVLIVQGQTDDSISLSFGYGKKSSESIADGIGVNAYALQRSDAPWGLEDLVVEKTARQVRLALAQTHFSIEGRADEIALHATLADFRKSPDFAKPRNVEKKSLYVLPQRSPRQWGMVVDLAACTGCSACVVACQAENNIAVVGKAGVLKGREMHWMRIDRYVETEDDDARPISEPMLCQHCEKAPCEYVCPTNATTHSSDGLNQMVYNRCVGTRFCSNNCPWKVRRFNWFDYDKDPDAADPRVHNPDVTVRSRGVMEKCTYCVQRIRETEIQTKVEGREIRDHDVKTACEQACPSAAIVFGDIGNARTDVSEARRNPRLFAVLNDLGTVPHTRYLAKIENPNEDLD